MQLSDYDGICFKVMRNGAFEVLGDVRKKNAKSALGYAMSQNFLIAACKNPDIACIICQESLAEDVQLLESGKGIAVYEHPKAAFILLHNYLVQNSREYNFERYDTKIGTGCKIHPTASIAGKGVTIGNNVTIEEFAAVREGCQIGDNAIIRSGAVIGADNYNICWEHNGHMLKMKEAGQTFLASNVEIGCHAVIAKATFPHERTVIGENTCIDSLAMISHACQIGRNCLIASHSNICGYVIIEDGVRIDPGAVVKHSITVGKNAAVSLGAVVVRNVPRGTTVTGNFAIEHSKFLADHLNKLRNR